MCKQGDGFPCAEAPNVSGLAAANASCGYSFIWADAASYYWLCWPYNEEDSVVSAAET